MLAHTKRCWLSWLQPLSHGLLSSKRHTIPPHFAPSTTHKPSCFALSTTITAGVVFLAATLGLCGCVVHTGNRRGACYTPCMRRHPSTVVCCYHESLVAGVSKRACIVQPATIASRGLCRCSQGCVVQCYAVPCCAVLHYMMPGTYTAQHVCRVTIWTQAVLEGCAFANGRHSCRSSCMHHWGIRPALCGKLVLQACHSMLQDRSLTAVNERDPDKPCQIGLTMFLWQNVSGLLS